MGRRAQFVAHSLAAPPVVQGGCLGSQTFSAAQNNSVLQLSLMGPHNLGLFRNMTKLELQQKLHETLCEKDKMNERMTQAIREKLESETSMI